MNQQVTTAIILSRTDYGEADRILTVLTPDYGKLRLMAKGVRRIKSKMAGGIELFSISTITFVQGRGGMGTLISTRLITHYRHIVTNLDRTMLGYELIAKLNKTTEDETEPEYFDLLSHAFEALDDGSVDLTVIHCWFLAQLLRLNGHTPNLATDDTGLKLAAGQGYGFAFEHMAFGASANGSYTVDHIKFLRLLFSGHTPKFLARIGPSRELAATCMVLVSGIERHAA